MSELEEKLGQVLSNPQMMQQIMSLAQSLGTSQPPKQEPTPTPKPDNPSIPNLNPKLLQSLAGIAQQGGMDQNQQALLQALSPFLSHGRIHKLERAMQASRMAGAASAFLNAGGLQMLRGR